MTNGELSLFVFLPLVLWFFLVNIEYLIVFMYNFVDRKEEATFDQFKILTLFSENTYNWEAISEYGLMWVLASLLSIPTFFLFIVSILIGFFNVLLILGALIGIYGILLLLRKLKDISKAVKKLKGPKEKTNG